MNQEQLKTPLLQSAAVIIIGLVCFGFVVSSGSDSLFGGIGAIVMGFLYTILYVVALALGITFCIGCLVAIFLGAVYLFSKEQASIFYNQLKTGLCKLTEEAKGYFNKCTVKCNISKPTRKVKQTEPTTVPPAQDKDKDDLNKKIADLEAKIADLQESEKRNSQLLEEFTKKQ